MSDELVFHAKPPRYQCPACGFITPEPGMFGASVITVTIEPFNGIYCMKCWAAWIAANVPKMNELTDPRIPSVPVTAGVK